MDGYVSVVVVYFLFVVPGKGSLSCPQREKKKNGLPIFNDHSGS